MINRSNHIPIAEEAVYRGRRPLLPETVDLLSEESLVGLDLSFYKGKKILITGHTGFKGAWLSFFLILLGANVTGFSLKPPADSPSLFEILGLSEYMNSVIGDIGDLDSLQHVFQSTQPEIVFHLAAQSLVLEGYKSPLHTYAANVAGTVNVLEAVRSIKSVRSFLNVTTDKVYRNDEDITKAYSEIDPMQGDDPYSSSKICSEIITSVYAKNYLNDLGCSVSTVRAGNVIGGGDFASYRILPDCVRAACGNTQMLVRNPSSIRPYQHVLEALSAYLMIAEQQFNHLSVSGSYNVGPDDCDCVTTDQLVRLFGISWGSGFSWSNDESDLPEMPESQYLKLDSSKLKQAIGWQPKWHISTAIEKVVEWTRDWVAGKPIGQTMYRQIKDYVEG